MGGEIEYSRAERIGLVCLGTAGFVAINGIFAWGVLFRRETLAAALGNPIAAAFMAEALILMGVLAYLLGRWGVSRLSWGWFVLLSLLGSMAFALPVVLLWPRGKGRTPPADGGGAAGGNQRGGGPGKHRARALSRVARMVPVEDVQAEAAR